MYVRTVRLFALYASLLTLPLAVTACGSDSPSEPPPQPDGIAVGNDFFNPATLTVSPGTAVTWTWGSTGGIQHNVTWVDGELTNSPTQASGTHQVTMPTEPGDYDYYCTLHGTATTGMRGTVRVE